jgi:hypothetical protein
VTRAQAVVFLGGQLTAGLGVLLQLNPYRSAICLYALSFLRLRRLEQYIAWGLIVVTGNNLPFHEAHHILATGCIRFVQALHPSDGGGTFVVSFALYNSIL